MHTIGLPRTCLGCTNILFLILGSIGFIICVWCAANTEFFKDVNYTITKSSLVETIANFVNLKFWLTPLTSIFIPIAVIAIMTSCCGILGASCQVKCAAKSYIFLVTLLSMVFGWFFYVSIIYNIYTGDPKILDVMSTTLKNNYGKNDDIFTFVWNYIMVHFECCGVIDYNDFIYSDWRKDNLDKFYPIQCCLLSNITTMKPVFVNCTLTAQKIQPYIHTEGCFNALKKAVVAHKTKLILYFVLLTFAFAVVILFAYCIIKGQPLLGSMAMNAPIMPFRKLKIEKPNAQPQQSDTSLENMIFADEAPKKIVKVVSASNPFQTYEYRSMDYGVRSVPQVVPQLPPFGGRPIPSMHPHNARTHI